MGKITNINKTRQDRLSFHQTALRPKVLKSIPKQKDGSEGDIMLGSTIGGYMLYAKINNEWITFAPEEKKKTRVLYFLQGGFQGPSGHAALYIPLANGETESTSANYGGNFILPFNCHIKRIFLRSENNCASTVAKLYKAADGTENPATLIDSVTKNLGANITTVFDFTGAKLYEGEVIAITVDASATMGDCVFNLILEIIN